MSDPYTLYLEAMKAYIDRLYEIQAKLWTDPQNQHLAQLRQELTVEIEKHMRRVVELMQRQQQPR